MPGIGLKGESHVAGMPGIGLKGESQFAGMLAQLSLRMRIHIR